MNTAVKTYTNYEGFITALRNAEVLRKRNRQNPTEVSEELKFRPITHADMETIFQYLQMETGRTTDFSYAGILMWVDYFKYEYAISDETLFIKGVVENDTETPAFSLPIGKLPLRESLEKIRSYCRSKNIPAVLSAVPEYAIEELEEAGISSINPLEDWGDYLYDAEKLSTLSGKKMSKKRNHVNKFDSLYTDSRLEPLDASNVDRAIEFMTIVDEEGDDVPMAVEERRMTRKLLDLIKEGDIRLEGAILMVGDEVAAFTIGDVKNDTLFVHVEKASRAFDGSYEKINKEYAALMCARHPEIKFINREDDSGDEGLRKAKQSYHPVEILNKYNIAL
ncbi:MAG: phosphatidylglycerol lysyltransferase domain-containing protein [Muribaculaceae bacterium]|nr:phosphatidylglycerol lysyltransferase domain-containing protein [Muribaculaceae bacterium]MDE6551876.1 phosphatidylglycerol lysyltransferase domain-containing protein [Muribaculaceae bacterium]